MNIYFVMIIGGIIGLLLSALKKMSGINKRIKEATLHMVWTEFWKQEWLYILTSVVCYLGLLFVANEFVDLYHLEEPNYAISLKERLLRFRVANFIKVSSVLCGYFSSDIVYYFLGVTEKNLTARFKATYSAPKDEELNRGN